MKLKKSLIRITLLIAIAIASVYLYIQTINRKAAHRDYLSQTEKYHFTSDWFSHDIPVWREYLSPLKGKPNLRYLEIGLFEGRSALWMLENILTHPTSTLTGIDIFTGELKERYLSNLEKSGFAEKATTIVGYSQQELKKLPLESFDIIYVDGAHRAQDVLADAVLSWDLLKAGGLIIFDDYLWERGELPDELRPQIAIDAFITAFSNTIEIIYKGYQIILKKIASPCGEFFSCTPMGQYIYVWPWDKKGYLYDPKSQTQVVLSEDEKRLIESLAKSRRLGQTQLFLSAELAGDKAFQELSKRLDLNYSNIER
ncbi:MAG: class I SAM-dependent methyltransferase [Candidatus Omnitrophica bacterium]|nr:class I SAM-dependent methyltransferase [Candidatus Omnitrophota bacterium]